MAAYIVFIREGKVVDADALATYRATTMPNLADYGLKPLAVYGTLEGVEGAVPDGAVILEFPTIEQARAWYHSDAYQAAAAWRRKAADYRAFIIDGLPTAGAAGAGDIAR